MSSCVLNVTRCYKLTLKISVFFYLCHNIFQTIIAIMKLLFTKKQFFLEVNLFFLIPTNVSSSVKRIENHWFHRFLIAKLLCFPVLEVKTICLSSLKSFFRPRWWWFATSSCTWIASTCRTTTEKASTTWDSFSSFKR
jgi:hypothetical protein